MTLNVALRGIFKMNWDFFLKWGWIGHFRFPIKRVKFMHLITAFPKFEDFVVEVAF